ncbi:MAG: T9SS type A sorting domain-containing protein [Janthinobacterium lividum]
MQKPLNTHPFTLYSLLQRILSTGKSRVFFSLIILLSGLAFPAAADDSGFYKDFIILTRSANGNNPSTNYFYTYGGSPTFNSLGSLGSFDRGSGQLLLGGESNIYNNNGDVTQTASLLYRVYRQGTIPGNFSSLPLTFNSKGGDGNPNNSKWTNTITNPNLLSGASGAGTYVLEMLFNATVTYNNNGYTGNYSIYDSNNGNNYIATFDVTGNVPTNWNSGNSQNDGNWFNSANWSNGVPNSTTDAVISYANNGIFPKIDVTNTSTDQVAAVRTLRIEGNGAVTGAILSLNGLELDVYGDFIDTYSGFTHSGGLLVLAGNDQSFDGGVSPFLRNIKIDGGGTKALARNIIIVKGSTLTFASGKVTTNATNNYSIVLQDGAFLSGESEDNYIEGAVTSTNTLTEGGSANFGNIGLELFTRIGSPGSTVVTRRTNRIYTGAGTSTSIRRSFTINSDSNLPDVQSYDITFHYLNNELNSIPTDNLLLFRSVTGSAPFIGLGKNSNDASAKTLTRTAITGTLNATFTLGNSANPLPVTIISFTAVAQGADAVLNWTTASETNNQGFEVQVSTDGTNFSKLSFLAVNTPNSSTPHSYQYRDVTVGKQGTRYYRLRQLDLDGTESFVAPQAVTFNGVVAQGTSLQGYPSPFSSEINLAMQATAAGLAMVTVTDGVGRQVRTWQPTLAAGASSLRLAELQNMPAGLYIVQVRYNDGQTQRLKMVKE